MIIKNVSNKIIKDIAKELENYGFSSRKSHQFVRRINDVTQIISLLFHREGHNIFLEVEIQIKIKAIEDIYIQVQENEFILHGTLRNNLFSIIDYYDKGDDIGSDSFNKKYLLESEKDLNTIIKILPKRVEEYVLPYFESNGSIEQVDKLLNEAPQKMSVHCYLYPLRACVGIIAAKLVNNPKYEEILKIYEEELRDANPINKNQFEKLKLLLSYY